MNSQNQSGRTVIEGTTRREFCQVSAKAMAAVAAPTLIAASALGRGAKVAPSERITIGLIGIGRQARAYNLPWFLKSPETQVVALCDVDSWRLKNAAETVRKQTGTVAIHADFRSLLDDKSIDAVMISTPDHWHVPMSIAALRKGKDVCCEKPITKSIAEGRRLVQEVEKHKRIFRVDSEARFKTSFCKAAEAVRNGRLGKLVSMEVGVPIDNAKCGSPATMPVPKELNYEMWQGPAATAPYTVSRVHPQQAYSRPGWMRVQDYDDGMITNWGAHLIDIAHWGANLERTGPVQIQGTGVFPKSELWNVLQQFKIDYQYANGVKLTVKPVKGHYTRFVGEDGWVEAGFSQVRASSPEVLQVPLGKDRIRLPRTDEKQDFVNCVKSRGRPIADAEVGHRTNSIGLLGVIAVKTGQPLRWNPETEQFVDNAEADKLLERSLREPWKQLA
ncbi:MAG: Gfo/Idh/MocA family oxidoreductase [Pirellulaceae bacterium]